MAKKKSKKRKKSRKSVVWLWIDCCGEYCIGDEMPNWDSDVEEWDGYPDKEFCSYAFERLFPFFTMPPNSLGKITNTKNTLTFEIIDIR
jgi:hypothetical protein